MRNNDRVAILNGEYAGREGRIDAIDAGNGEVLLYVYGAEDTILTNSCNLSVIQKYKKPITEADLIL